ncbi:hypothetical protein ACKWTF_009490 [Chironomus riparius]
MTRYSFTLIFCQFCTIQSILFQLCAFPLQSSLQSYTHIVAISVVYGSLQVPFHPINNLSSPKVFLHTQQFFFCSFCICPIATSIFHLCLNQRWDFGCLGLYLSFVSSCAVDKAVNFGNQMTIICEQGLVSRIIRQGSPDVLLKHRPTVYIEIRTTRIIVSHIPIVCCKERT